MSTVNAKTKTKATRAPRPGTFAAWVYAQPLTESPAALARRAHAADKRWSTATAQSVYNVRWYYGLTKLARDARPATVTPAPAAVATRAARLSAMRTAAVAAPPELVAMVGRYGVDATRRAIAFYESSRHTDRVLALPGGTV